MGNQMINIANCGDTLAREKIITSPFYQQFQVVSRTDIISQESAKRPELRHENVFNSLN